MLKVNPTLTVGGLDKPATRRNLAPTPDDPTPEILEYWRAVMARKWMILAISTACGLAAWGLVSQMAPIYRSTSTLLIESARAKVTSIEEVYSNASSNREYFQTQTEVLKSRDVAARAAGRLDLVGNAEFDPRLQRPPEWQQWAAEKIPALAGWLDPPPPKLDAKALESGILRRFNDRLSIEPVRLSQLVKINFESTDPDLAARAANAVASAYIAIDIDVRSRINREAGELIDQHLGELKAKLDASEKALQAYRDREGILDSRSTASSGTGRTFEELTQRLVEARVRRGEAEEAYNQAQAASAANNYDSIPAVIRNNAVQNARAREAEAARRLNEISQRYGPDHPKYATAQGDQKLASENTRKEINDVIRGIQREYSTAQATERGLQDALAQSKGAIQALNRKEIQVSGLERDAESNRQLYQLFLSRHKETAVATDAQQPSARVIDLAIPALVPGRPAKTRYVALAVLAGIAVGVLAALLSYSLDATVRNAEDVSTRLRQTLLASLPRLSRGLRKQSARIVLDAPQEVYAEGIRTALTGLLLSTLDQKRRMVAVTSSVPDEGKSTFATNLALWHARTRRTLLIDCDFRRPSVGNSLKLPRTTSGLAAYLANSQSLDECVVRLPDSRLDILQPGLIPIDSALDVLLSERFGTALSQLQDEYDLIIIDTPPVNLVADPLVIGHLCVGLIYVLKAGKTPVQLARKCLRRIEEAGIDVIGIVLNDHDFKKAEKYYGDYASHGKYGYSRGDGKLQAT